MTRNLKALGLALVAVLAMSAMVASAASAATFTATKGAKIQAESNSIEFTTTEQGVKCNKTVFKGTAPAASFTSITFNAEFAECKSTSGIDATVTGFGQHGEAKPCDFVFYATGTIDLVCPAGEDLTVDIASCLIHIPGQVGLGTVTYFNNGPHVAMSLNIVKITANHTDGFLCPFGSSGTVAGTVLETTAGALVTAVPSIGTFTWDA